MEPFIPHCIFLEWSSVKELHVFHRKDEHKTQAGQSEVTFSETDVDIVERKPFISDHKLWALCKTRESKDMLPSDGEWSY